MKEPSFTLTAKRHFKTSLTDQEPIFPMRGSVLVQQRHKDWPALTQWGIGSSAICAKLIVDLLPKKHVRTSQMRYRDDPQVLLADIVEISEAAFKSVLAFEFSGGDRFPGLVTLEPSEPILPASVRSRTKSLFTRLLAEQPSVFQRSSDYLLVGQLDDSWRHPSHHRFGKNLKDAQRIGTFFPAEHLRHLRIVVKETNLHLAYVIMLSAAAMAAVSAWEECKRSNDVKTVLRKVNQLSSLM